MAKKKGRKFVIDEAEADMEMTPMIDIVFQLLIFFLLSAKFIALEGQLASYLPKDRGLQSSFSEIELANVTFFLDWVDDQPEGRVRCRTMDYRPSGGGARIPVYEFNTEDGRFKIAYGPQADDVHYGYHVPSFSDMESYLQDRHSTYTGGRTGLPVTINVEDKVPMQMVTNIVDSCARLGISNVTIAAKEAPY